MLSGNRNAIPLAKLLQPYQRHFFPLISELKASPSDTLSRTVALRPQFRHASHFNIGEWISCRGSTVAATNEVQQAEIQATTVLYILPKPKVGSWFI
jgi:hypothetical protein